jgi:hypothetical protein
MGRERGMKMPAALQMPAGGSRDDNGCRGHGGMEDAGVLRNVPLLAMVTGASTPFSIPSLSASTSLSSPMRPSRRP